VTIKDKKYIMSDLRPHLT